MSVKGPIEEGTWPETLTAHVVEPGAEPRVLGYAAESDLARNYGFLDVILLLLRGELPDTPETRALDVALCFLAPAHVGLAPVHAACLSRLCGAASSGALGVAAVSLAEEARFVLEEHAALLDWLALPASPLPDEYRARDSADRDAVARLVSALEDVEIDVPALAQDPTRTAAILSVLFHAGVRTPSELELVWTLARLPAAFAEARRVKAAALRDYPMNTPPFEYEAER